MLNLYFMNDFLLPANPVMSSVQDRAENSVRPFVVYHEAYEVDIGPHVFPTSKYRLVRQRLLEEGTITEADLVRPERATDEQISLVHAAEYIRKLKEGDFTLREVFALEVPFSPVLKEVSWICTGGSILTGRLALEHGRAVHLGGGFHHAFPDHGEGFCVINDIAVAMRVLLEEGLVGRGLVIDCDVHHGNGTAAIFREEPKVFTFSMHQQRNYPMVKPPSDLDLGLEDGIGDGKYLKLLERHLPQIVDRHRPDLVFYLAGADPYKQDRLGGLKLSLEGLKQRDTYVLETLAERKVPAAVVLAGGYAFRPEDTVEIHSTTVRVASLR